MSLATEAAALANDALVNSTVVYTARYEAITTAILDVARQGKFSMNLVVDIADWSETDRNKLVTDLTAEGFTMTALETAGDTRSWTISW